MKKFYFLFFLLISNYTLLKAQNPTDQEPADPGIISFPNKKLNVYPNPSSGKFNLDLDYTPGSNVTVMVWNENGIGVAKKFVAIKATSQKVSFNLSNYAPGKYIVEVISKKGIKAAAVYIEP